MNWFIICIFLISITFFIITKYYYLKQQSKLEKIEAFESESKLTSKEKLSKYHNITIKYINAEEAKQLIKKNGVYLQGMNQANLSARHCSDLDDLYNKYLSGFDDITENEKKTVDTFLLKLLTDIQKYNVLYYKYVKNWLQNINFTKAKKWLESGMPHTLDNTIVMDADWFTNPRKVTLLHEIAHIHQRNDPLDFDEFYPSLGYLYNPADIKGLEYIYPLNRNNPDGTSKYWLWNDNVSNGSTGSTSLNISNTYWIGAIFQNATPNSLTDVNMVALQLDNGSDGTYYYIKQNPIQLNKLKSFVNFFGENPNNYHPNEMTAKFAEWYLIDVLRERTNNNYEGYKIYKKYFEKLINKYYA